MRNTTLPVAVYRNGIRYVVAEVWVQVEDDVDTNNMEIDITMPRMTRIREKTNS